MLHENELTAEFPEFSVQVSPEKQTHASSLHLTFLGVNVAIDNLMPTCIGDLGRFLLSIEKKLIGRKRIIVSPSYGGEYDDKIILKDWLKRKDFTVFGETAQINKEDAEKYGFLEVVVIINGNGYCTLTRDNSNLEGGWYVT